MTAAAEPAGAERADARTIVGGGIKLGILTAAGVAAFALLSRVMTGTPELVVQCVLVLVGGVVFSYLPALFIGPRSADSIAWTALVGLIGALVFTVIDTALLRPLNLYHWTWDRIGGGSGFWYVPVWWMLSAALAWLGGWVSAIGKAGPGPSVFRPAALTVGLCVVLFGIMTVPRLLPVHAAVMALAWGIAVVVHVPVAAAMAKR
jgi:hypothetical protein